MASDSAATGALAVAANVYLASRPGLGLGVYAQRSFKPGDFLFSATGHVISHQTMFSLQIDWDKHLDDFYALRAIAKDEEIRYDYAMTEYRHYERPRPEMDFDLTCRCGAPACRGRFGYYAEITPELKAKYRGFISDYLVNSDAPEDPLREN